MVVDQNNAVFRPSRALPPFAVVFFLLVILLTMRIFALAPLLVALVLLPFVLFALWWFANLFAYSLRFWIQTDDRAIMIQQPTPQLIDTDIVSIPWEEIKNVEFHIDDNFNPKHFTGRNVTLTFFLNDGTTYVVNQMTVIDHYPELLTIIQQHKPFLYSLPMEQMWDPKVRVAILAALAALLFVLLIIFLL